MKIQLSALFDDPDSADLALMRLRQNGITAENISLIPKQRHDTDDGGVRMLAMPEAPGTDRSLAQSWPDSVFPFAFVGINYDQTSRMMGGAAPTGRGGGETRLQLRVDPSCAERAEDLLISSHGRDVRMPRKIPNTPS